ncbi:recombinase family protein [Bacillus sp. BGMRC 2118]|nr:recombinase family protein [Bacillus sp. BGMRC 2118]
MKAALYIRVSTDEQAKEGYSIASQKDRTLKFVESQGWELHDFYIDDGYSAKNLNRPEIQRLMKDATEKKFDVVVFYKLDRLIRSVKSLHDLLHLFEDNNVKIKSVTEVFDTTTAMGRFFITLVGAMAEWERDTISERVVENMAKKATLGERNGGRAPFGYRIKDGQLVIDKKESRLVKEVFRLYMDGKGMRQISLYLQQFNVNKGIRTISRMLDNPVYSGKLRWAKNSKLDEIVSDIPTHEAIIDEEIFEKVQQLRNVRTIEGKKATSPFPFSGVLRCARCGSSLSGWNRKAKGTKHYLCINKKNNASCDLPIINESVLTEEFLNSFSPTDPDKFIQLIQNFEHDNVEFQDNSELIEELEKELTAIKQRKKTWLMALGNNVMSQDEYLEMTKEDTRKEILIKEQLEELSKSQVHFDKDSIISLINGIPDLWKSANEFEKKEFINELFDKIVIDVPKDYVRAPGRTPKVEIKEFVLN